MKHSILAVSLIIFSAFAIRAAQIPIASLPVVITKAGTYYFPTNMYMPTPTTMPQAVVAITVNALGPVTIDMRGFTLTGPGQQFVQGFYTNPVGITIASNNVAILNGKIQGFVDGISASGSVVGIPNVYTYLSGLNIENITFGPEPFSCLIMSLVNGAVVKNCDFSQQVDGDVVGDDGSQTGNFYINDKVNISNSIMTYTAASELPGGKPTPDAVVNIVPIRN